MAKLEIQINSINKLGIAYKSVYKQTAFCNKDRPEALIPIAFTY